MRGRSAGAGLLWLVALGALGMPPAVAQEAPDQQRAAGAPDERGAPQLGPERNPDEVELREEPKDPRGRHFFDDFSGATLERRHWESSTGATPTRELLDRDRPVAAVRLGADKRRPNRQPELRSVVIGLAGAAGAELSYTVQHQGVEAGERLVIEYLSANGRWELIERVVADGRDSVGFSRHMRVLPEDALHAAFQVRFRPQVDDSDDAWYLGEVSVAGYEPDCTLTVRARPARGARVAVVPAERPADKLDGTTPFSRSVPADACVHLVAPPVVDEWVFSHWSVDGMLQADRQRVLTLELNRDVEVVAYYRPWVSGRSEASVVVLASDPGVRIALGPEPQRLYAELGAGAEYRCLAGEWLALLAPLRCGRWVFAGWVVNGQVVAGADNLLEHRVGGDDVLLAEYVLLGDMNGDGELDKFDVDEFVLALVDPVGYAARYPEFDRTRRGDINGDGVFDALDVESFVDLLLSD